MVSIKMAKSIKNAWTLTELMVTIAIVGVVTGMTITHVGTEWRRERVLGASRELAAFLDSVRRSAMQTGSDSGSSCTATITNQITVNSGGTLASSQNEACKVSDSPLRISNFIGASYTVQFSPSTANSSIEFTQRGTVLHEFSNVDGTENPKPIQIGIHLSGDQGPMGCVEVRRPLGVISTGWANTTTLNDCHYQ